VEECGFLGTMTILLDRCFPFLNEEGVKVVEEE
jgi:hypothetical protein